MCSKCVPFVLYQEGEEESKLFISHCLLAFHFITLLENGRCLGRVDFSPRLAPSCYSGQQLVQAISYCKMAYDLNVAAKGKRLSDGENNKNRLCSTL
jgi:hypothetical protein